MFRDFQKGDVVSFAIHSPTRLFGEDAPVGKSFKFSVSIKYPEGSVRQFRGLEVKKELGEPATTGNAGKASDSSTGPEARRP